MNFQSQKKRNPIRIIRMIIGEVTMVESHQSLSFSGATKTRIDDGIDELHFSTTGRCFFFCLAVCSDHRPSIHPQIHPSSNPSSRKDLYKTVWEIKQRRVLDLAADRGAYIDQSQSLKLRHWSTFKWIKTMRFFCKGWVFFGEKRKRPGFGGDIGPMWSL